MTPLSKHRGLEAAELLLVSPNNSAHALNQSATQLIMTPVLRLNKAQINFANEVTSTDSIDETPNTG